MERRGRRVLLQAVTWPLTPLLLVGTALAEDDLSGAASNLGTVVAILACWAVGVVVTARSPEQPAGWAFVGLATALTWSGFCDELSAATTDPTVSDLFATLGDTSFVWWFVFLALVLQFTTPGVRRARLSIASVGCGVVYQVGALIRSTPLDPPRQDIQSPWAVDALDTPARILSAAAVYILGFCLIASVVVLVRAFRGATGETRQQLLWVVAGAIPLAPAVVAAFAFSAADRTELAAIVLGLAMVALVAGAGLSVLRYRLYDVERVVTESAAYAIAAVAVVTAFVAVVVVISRTTPVPAGSQLPTVLATLAGVVVARLAFVWGRRAVGRRVNPERFDAVTAVRTGLAHSTPDLDRLMVDVLGAGARVLYPAQSGGWVLSDGRPVEAEEHGFDVRRHGDVVARLEFDPASTDAELAEAVAEEAAAEIDNVALRAELARQVEVVSESRARLASAHLEERKRIERDLHDGAQQRLLAMALQLKGARLNGDTSLLADEADRTIAELQVTVQELRSLAAGLRPAALSAGGLLAAVADLAARAPLTIRYDVVDERFAAPVEGAAWFVVSEAFANAVKHADAEEVTVAIAADDGRLHVVVTDDGVGGADPGGSGLQGLADRVAAAGGTLQVSEVAPRGTRVEAVIPCAS